MTRRAFTWLYSSRSQKPRRRPERRAALDSLDGRVKRSLRFESVEDRLLLTHGAPVLNAADTAAFNPIQENITVASNNGEKVSDVLASGGSITNMTPLGPDFAFFDTTNGAKEGIAVTGLTGTSNGVWEYSTNGGTSWALLPNNLSYSNALVLSGDTSNNDVNNDKLRFLPNSNFTGTVSMQFSAWDQTDGKTPGSTVNLTAPGAIGGSTAYSPSGTSATLNVTSSSIPPTFTLSSASTFENNTVTASGGLPGGSNPNVIPAPNFASNIRLGSGGSTSVSFAVTDVTGNFSTLFAQNPAIDSQGTLTYQLKPDVFGLATFNVTATNGSVVSSPVQSTINVIQINDPPTLGAIASPAPVLDSAGPQSVQLSGITAGLNESQVLSINLQNDNPSLLTPPSASYTSPNSTGSVNYTPVSGHSGTAHVTVTVQDRGGTANGGVDTSAPQTFTVTVRTAPQFTVGPSERVLQNTAQNFSNWATGINSGFPGASVSFTITSDSNPGLFSAAPLVSSSGAISFTTNGNYGTANLSVTMSSVVNGQTLTTAAQSFSITVVAPPTAYPETYEVNYTGSSSTPDATTGVLANDYDPNAGGVKTAVLTGNPANGSISLGSNGSFTYTSGGTFQGLDRFSYKVVDSPANGNIVTDTVYSHEGALVNKLYPEILSRPASDNDITYGASHIHNNNFTLASLAGSLITSDEHLNPAINTLYMNFLGRGVDPNGLTWAKGVWRQSGGPEQVMLGIGVTDECYNHAQNVYGATGNQAWVTLIYWQVLGRAPDSSYFWDQMNLGRMTRQQVEQTLLGSSEYCGDVITRFYSTYLNRSPGQTELSYWVGQMQSGVSELTIQEDFVGTTEYTNAPPAPSPGSVYWLTH